MVNRSIEYGIPSEGDVVHPFVKICDQNSFENADLREFRFAISIQSKGSHPVVLRPDFRGTRLDLYFDDVTEGPGAAMPADIEALFDFGREWVAEVRHNPSARTIVHCGAGISRSGAAALMLLTLYFGAYQPGAAHLFRTHPYVVPNIWICRLISEKLGPTYGDILEALSKGKEQASQA
jgi:predicted protein tyrosine phosphatase